MLCALALILCPALAHAGDIVASTPKDISATIYRAPYRNGGSISLDNLGGFALITETRTVHLMAGENRLLFEGVADGIIPQSAIVTGLPDGVIEKNRDAAVLSPDALMRAAVGSDLTFRRANRKTGRTETIPVTLRSASADGVVFQTADGVETLRCSGAPETFRYSRAPAGLTSTPMLSAMTRAKGEIAATVTLSYLAQGFDWAADYTATINPDGRTLELGAWITLANGNGESFPAARTQFVAGKLNRVYEAMWIDPAPRVIATCWPMETTSDVHPEGDIPLVQPYGLRRREELDGMIVVTAKRMMNAPSPVMMMAPAAPPPPPLPEQLGDLKLYRTPHLTTIASRQSKQTRLLEQPGVAFDRVYQADLWAQGQGPWKQAQTILRTKNDAAHKLGLPLPAGHMAVFQDTSHGRLLAGETDLRDTAEGEDVDLKLGGAPDVQVRQTRVEVDAKPPVITPLAPPVRVMRHSAKVAERVEVTNAGAREIAFELRLQTGAAQHVTGADQPMAMKDGRPIFHLAIPAGGRASVTYQVE